MKRNLILLGTWLTSNPARIRYIMMGLTFALLLVAVFTPGAAAFAEKTGGGGG